MGVFSVTASALALHSSFVFVISGDSGAAANSGAAASAVTALRQGELGTILPPEQRAVRDLARKRMQLVRSRTSHILAIENIVARQLDAKINSNQIKRLNNDAVEHMGLTADVALAIESNLAVVTTLSAQIDLLEKRLQERVGERPEYGLLTSVPGIGRILATIILLETGTVDRFAAVGNFASYARCVDSQHLSLIHISEPTRPY